MADKFLHGVEVLEAQTGPRPIRTVRSSVIGLVGTAPDAEPDTKATLQTGTLAANNAVTFTAELIGVAGNQITVNLVDPAANSAVLSVAVAGNAITVNLATDATGVITTTAADLIAAIAGDVDAAALVTAANTTGSDGTGVVTATASAQSLTGGLNEPFPLNTPVLVTNAGQAISGLDNTTNNTGRGTLLPAIDGIYDQIGAVVIVVRVEEGATEEDTLANVVGGVNSVDGSYEGVHALLGAESVTGFAPRIVCAPGWTHQRPNDLANPVVAELIGVLNRLRAVCIVDGPNTTDEAAITAAGDHDSRRLYLVDPWVKVFRDGVNVDEPPSARIAGLMAKIDNDRGFWWSPSNNSLNGIVGTSRPVDFKLGDANGRANLLNERVVATIINQNGYRLWGNRTLSSDPRYAFLSVGRTQDIINDSLLRAHLWAVDRNITKTYVEDVTDSVNAYLRSLVALGAILGGECFPDPDLNTPANITQGKVYFNFDFTPVYPAEHITFTSELTDRYIDEVI